MTSTADNSKPYLISQSRGLLDNVNNVVRFHVTQFNYVNISFDGTAGEKEVSGSPSNSQVIAAFSVGIALVRAAVFPLQFSSATGLTAKSVTGGNMELLLRG